MKTEMKKIRLDYYEYLIRKGRAFILLEPVPEKPGSYRMPSHLVGKEERIDRSMCRWVGDDGDLVLYQVALKEGRTGTARGTEWVSLEALPDLYPGGIGSEEARFRIFDFLSDLLPREGDSGLCRRVAAMRDEALSGILRQKYVRELQDALDGKWDCPGLTPPDPRLVSEELRSLSRFRRRSKKENPMCQADVTDGYEPVDWTGLGSRVLSGADALPGDGEPGSFPAG